MVESLMVQRQGRVLSVRAKNYVLAGGGTENARLLLATQRHWPAKIGGPQGALGRFYQGPITGHIFVIELADKRVEKALSFQKDKEGRHFRRRLQVSAGRQHDNHLLNAAFWLDALSIADAAHGSGALSALYLPLAISGLYGMLSEGRAPKTARGRQQAIASICSISEALRRSSGILPPRRAILSAAGSPGGARYPVRRAATCGAIMPSKGRFRKARSFSMTVRRMPICRRSR
ncbi:hypothetical protein [Sinorhizobium fredii]|uniref:hypothetical protein n=1 Tax=Rhizobium fredii TaxID=380 RepID=UPI0012FDE22B|nr:hypothetical protein [Sinorhizobium fredii]